MGITEELRRGKKLIKLGKNNQAIEVFESLLHSTIRESALDALITMAEKLKDTNMARKYFQMATLPDIPTNVRMLIRWGDYEASVGNYNTAMEKYAEALSRKTRRVSNRTSANFGMGSVEFSRGKLSNAKARFNDILVLTSILTPDKDEVRDILYSKVLLGYIDMEEGNYDLANARFDSIIREKGKGTILGLHGKGSVELDRENYDLARQYFYEALNAIYVNSRIDESLLKELKHILKKLISLELVDGNIDEVKRLLDVYGFQLDPADLNKFCEYIKYRVDKNTTKEEKEVFISMRERQLNGMYKSSFYETIDFDALLAMVRKRLESDDIKNIISKNSYYYFRFDDPVATIDGEKTNCVRVVSFVDKTNIIAIYPVIWRGDTIAFEQKTKGRENDKY